MSLDQVPFSARAFWRDSAVVDVAPVDSFQELRVQPGRNTVVKVHDGVGAGRRSTAHARRVTVYFVLPRDIEVDAEYELSPADGTLFFDEFTGRDFGVIDESRPLHARVEVIRASPSRLRLRIDVSLTVMYGRDNDDPKWWWWEEFVLRDVETFRRE